MKTILRHQGPTMIWALLMLATLAGFGGARAQGWGFAVVMIAATVKARLIADYFMELRWAPVGWRRTFDGLIALCGGLILGLHLLA